MQNANQINVVLEKKQMLCANLIRIFLNNVPINLRDNKLIIFRMSSHLTGILSLVEYVLHSQTISELQYIFGKLKKKLKKNIYSYSLKTQNF